MSMTWNTSTENVPDSLLFVARTEETTRKLDKPFLIHAVRYSIQYGATLSFKINNKIYGRWYLFSGNGFVLVRPRIFIAQDQLLTVQLSKSDIDEIVMLSIDGETTRDLQ